MRANRKRTPLLTGRTAAAALVIVFVLGCVIGVGPWWLEPKLVEGAPHKDQWIYWLLVVSGNWNGAPFPTQQPGGEQWETALAAILAVLLNNALFITAAGLIWRTVLSWRTRVQISQAFVTKDQMNKQALFSRLGTDPGTVQAINQAFEEGDRKWRDNLIALFGEGPTNRLMEILNSQV